MRGIRVNSPLSELDRTLILVILSLSTGPAVKAVFRCLSALKKLVHLKGLAQAKIINKSVILFRVLNMTI